MTRPAKKNHELDAVHELLARIGVGDAVITAREGPDFVVTSAQTGSFGIEVVEVADPQLAKVQAAIKEQHRHLKAELEAHDVTRGVHLSTSDGFALLFSPREARARNVKAITELVLSLAKDPKTVTIHYEDLVKREIVGITSITISDSGALTEGCQSTGRQHPFVQQCIDAKNAKAADYRAELPEGFGLWLLLLTGIEFRSGVWSAILEDHVYVSAFDRTFCIDAYENKLIELKTRA